MRFDELRIGQSCEFKRVFTSEEVLRFAELSLDTNPLHTDAEFARFSKFGQLIVPGFLTASMFSAIIGTKFPGFGSIYLNQNMSFLRPVFPGMEVTAIVSVKELYPEKQRVLLTTQCLDEKLQLLIEGTALVKLP